MAVANSDFERAAGKTEREANIQANQTEAPVLVAAMPGKTKIPEPSIADTDIDTTAPSPSLLSSFFTQLWYVTL